MDAKDLSKKIVKYAQNMISTICGDPSDDFLKTIGIKDIKKLPKKLSPSDHEKDYLSTKADDQYDFRKIADIRRQMNYVWSVEKSAESIYSSGESENKYAFTDVDIMRSLTLGYSNMRYSNDYITRGLS